MTSKNVLIIENDLLFGACIESLLSCKEAFNIIGISPKNEADLIDDIWCMNPNVIILNKESCLTNPARLLDQLKNFPEFRLVVVNPSTDWGQVFDKQSRYRSLIKTSIPLTSFKNVDSSEHYRSLLYENPTLYSDRGPLPERRGMITTLFGDVFKINRHVQRILSINDHTRPIEHFPVHIPNLDVLNVAPEDKAGLMGVISLFQPDVIVLDERSQVMDESELITSVPDHFRMRVAGLSSEYNLVRIYETYKVLFSKVDDFISVIKQE